MGSTGNIKGAGGSSVGAAEQVTKTRENEYGFEIEDSNSPAVEFSDSVWQEMADLRGYGVFGDGELKRLVDDRISQLVDQYGDLERYDADLTTLRERIEENEVTDDEFNAGYHVMAKMLGIAQPRYTVWDADRVPWDERYGSVEQAEHWAAEHEGAYVYDTWKRKYRKIGGKSWRS